MTAPALEEHDEVVLEGKAFPGAEAAAALERDLLDRVKLTWLADNRLKVESKHWVGAFTLDDDTTIVITPKLPGNNHNVLTMIRWTAGLPHDETRRFRELETDDQGSLVDLLCLALCREAERLLSTGVLSDYVTRRDDLRYLRGRLDVKRQALAHFGRVDVLACEFESFEEDVPENRLVRLGLAAAARVAVDQDIRMRALLLHEWFEHLAPGHLADWKRFRQPDGYDRRTSGYREAHVWAIALLDNHAAGDPFQSTGNRTRAFFIDMNRLFEDFVEVLVRRSLKRSQLTVTAQARDSSVLVHNGKRWGSIRPDLLVSDGTARVSIDAKYKRYDAKRLGVSDIYQLFVYSQAYPGWTRTPRSVLLYPAASPAAADITVQVRPQGTVTGQVTAAPLHLPTIIEAMTHGDEGGVEESLRARFATLIGLTSK